MKRFNYNVAKLRNPSNGFEGLPAIAGESAYEIAVRLGTFTGTEEEWNNYIKTERDTAIKAIQDKAKEIMDSIPEDYTVLSSEVDGLKGDLAYKQDALIDRNLTNGNVRQGTRGDMSASLAYIATNKVTDEIPCKVGDEFVLTVESDVPLSMVLGTTSSKTETFSWSNVTDWVTDKIATIKSTINGFVRYSLRANDLKTPIANMDGFVANISVKLTENKSVDGVYGMVENGGIQRVAPYDEFEKIKIQNDIASVDFVEDLFSNKTPTIGAMTRSGVRTDGGYEGYKHYTIDIDEIVCNQLNIQWTFTGSAFDTMFFYDTNGELLEAWSSPIGVEKDGGRLVSVTDFPKGTIRIVVNVFLNIVAHAYQYIDGKRPIDISTILQLKEKTGISRWYGKKVVWLGTSIAFGQHAETTSYAYTASDILGFNLINTSFPGISLDVDSDTDTWTSALSISEQAQRGLVIPTTPSGYYPQHGMPNDYYRTWEHIFCEETSDADLYVYAVLPNNRNWEKTDWDLFDKTNWRYTDGSSFESHRSTFLGALLFMMDKMYTSNPNARMVFCVDLDGYSYTNGLPLLEEVSEAFGIPIINLWKKLQYNPKTKNLIRYTDGVHLNDYAHIHMGKIMSGEMLYID